MDKKSIFPRSKNRDLMIERFVSQINVLSKQPATKNYLLAVSGGIDSCVLMHLFYKSGFHFSVAHCNFQLRGEESETDQRFVEALANQYGAPFHTTRFNTTQYSKEKGISIQMAARDLRYAWFEEVLLQQGYDFIVTAHNANDDAETMLLNLSRGTGLRGLVGMRPIHNHILRPLLFASRKEITDYSRDHELNWREDSSNASIKYHRNKIRHTIIPAFESINPAFLQTTKETIRKLDQTGKILDFTLEIIKKDVWISLPDRILIDIQKLKSFPASDIVLFELLRDYGINHLDIHEVVQLLDSQPGKQLHTLTHIITQNRQHLLVTPLQKTRSCSIEITKDIQQISDPIQLSFHISEKTSETPIIKAREIAMLDVDTLKFPLILRKWNAGDRFRPIGLKGSKKVSDFLTDQKVSLPDKNCIWVIESNKEIAWIVNYRIDGRFCISDQTTKILTIRYQG